MAQAAIDSVGESRDRMETRCQQYWTRWHNTQSSPTSLASWTRRLITNASIPDDLDDDRARLISNIQSYADPFSRWLLAGIGGCIVGSQPAVAQSSSELLKAGFCNRWVAPVLVALWGLFVLSLVGTGIFRFANGWRKRQSNHPQTTFEGRKEMKGSRFAFIAVILAFAAERLFAFLVVDLVDCVSSLMM